MQKQNADTSLRSSLFADNERLQFLKTLDNGFVKNLGKNVVGLKFEKENAKLSIRMIMHPKYLRYVSKIQRIIKAKYPGIEFLYRIFAFLYYVTFKLFYI